MSCSIKARLPEGIKIVQLESDIEMLVSKGLLSDNDLVDWCDQIGRVTKELNELNALFEKFMPHKTAGKCHGLDIVGFKGNRLLSLMMDVSYTQQQFIGSIMSVKKRVSKMVEKRIFSDKQRNLI